MFLNIVIVLSVIVCVLGIINIIIWAVTMLLSRIKVFGGKFCAWALNKGMPFISLLCLIIILVDAVLAAIGVIFKLI